MTPEVIVTTWKLDGRAGYWLIQTFSGQSESPGPAVTPRQAQRATMAIFPHPIAWSPFGLTVRGSDS